MATGWHDGKWWPLFVPEWYHPKVSQYFFDPYSFLHIIHGFVFYGLWGWWPPQLVGSYTFQFFWMFVLGAILALLVELVFEIIENTQCCIDRWRSYIETIEHSDSVQNSVGDIISAVIGWYLAAGFHYADLPWLVLVWYSVTEVVLLAYMRNCGFLIMIQMFCQNKAIQAWQKEGIDNAKEADRKEAEDETGRRGQY